MNGSIYVENSGNSKTGKVDATYASTAASCPLTCPLKNNGCYAFNSYVGIVVGRLNKEAEELSVLQVARAEAQVIDQSYNAGPVPAGRNLRLHVSGDSRTIAGTRIINNALGRWKQRGGGVVWSYTHCWDHITRDMWTNVEMLASVDSIEEVEYARQNGYAPAIVVSEHPSERVYQLPGSDVNWIPCPAQTRHVGCCDCKLCFNVDRLYKSNMGISFAAHGVKKNAIKRRLTVIK